MADLITRIRLEDKQFDNTIKKSQQSLKGFEGQAKGTSGSVGGLDSTLTGLLGGVGKFAGVVGVATTAAGAFKAIIGGTQTTGDAFANTMGAVKTSVDNFFTSISSGDFSVFTNGLGEVLAKAKLAKETLDQLGNATWAFDFAKSGVSYEISKARADAQDTELDPASRKEALAKWKDAMVGMEEYSETIQNDLEKALATVTASRNLLDANSITIDDIGETLLIDIKGRTRAEVKKQYAEEYKEYLKAVDEAKKDATEKVRKGTYAGGRYTENWTTQFDEGKFKQELTELNERFKPAVLANTLLEKMSDKELVELYGQAQKYNQAGQDLEQLNIQFNRMKPRIERQIAEQEKGGGGGTKVPVNLIPEGSLADIDKQISDAKKRFNEAISDSARQEAEALIAELEQKKLTIEVAYKYSDTGNIPPGQIAPLQTSSKLDAINEMARLNKELKEAEERLKRSFDAESIRKATAEVTKLKGEIQTINEQHGIKPLIDTKTTEGSSQAVGSINDVTNAISTMGYALSGSSSNWLQWGANVVSSIATAIPAIMALTAAEEVKAGASAKAAAAGAAASVAAIPIAGPIMAVSAIASIVAALSAIPKFEFGGVVGGNSYTGDKILARVNSGELILNKKQQEVIYNSLESGTGAGVKQVELKLRGRDMMALIDIESLIRKRV